jgi:transposase-like protein
MPIADYRDDKLGGPRFVVQIDETILNYKCKSRRGQLLSNKTDALCIVEVLNGIQRAFACIIPNKRDATLIPIICSQVADNSTIRTDEHRSYRSLSSYGFIHESFCHKYEFITDSGVNSQAVEFFNNYLKKAIKNRKGIN